MNMRGVFAAAVTPLDENFALIPDAIHPLLSFLAGRGCHGVLLLGTTGEGPSFSSAERLEICRQAALYRQEHPEFSILVGTGTPSLDETITLTRAAFDHGLDGVVVLPPYYYKKISDDGLFQWYSHVIRRAVPAGGNFLGYHIPAVSGVGLSLDLIARLQDAFPRQFAGIKDSSGDPALTQQLGTRFGSDLAVFNGNDSLFSLALQNQAAGCITALANLYAPKLRRIWDDFSQGEATSEAQASLSAKRQISDRFAPAPALLKAMLNRIHGLPAWAVRPPLSALSAAQCDQALAEFIRQD